MDTKEIVIQIKREFFDEITQKDGDQGVGEARARSMRRSVLWL